MDTELSINEFYLLVSPSGDILKTKHKEDFDAVVSWSHYVFAEKVKGSDYVHYFVGKTWHKKLVSRLVTSRSYAQCLYYDFEELDTSIGSHIKRIEIGGKTRAVTYENL